MRKVNVLEFVSLDGEPQAQAADQQPDQPCAVIFVDQPFDVNAAQHKLLSIDGG